MGIEVAPPDINESDEAFTVVGERIRLGLAAVKGVGHKAVQGMIEVRAAGGAFRDLYDFTERVDTRTVNRSVVEALIKCGAFDSLGGHRAQYAAALDGALHAGAVAQQDRDRGQMSMFDALDDGAAPAALPEAEPWDDARMLAGEKDVLGFYISGHPLARHADALETYRTATTDRLDGVPAGVQVILGGIVLSKRTRQTARGPMAFFWLEDLHGKVECTLAGTAYEQFAASLAPDSILFVVGTVSSFREQPTIRVDNLVALDDAPLRFSSHVDVRLSCVGLAEDTLQRLHGVCAAHGGQIPLRLVLATTGGYRAVVEAGSHLRVAPSDAFLREVAEVVGPDRVRLVGPRGNGNGKNRRGAVPTPAAPPEAADDDQEPSDTL
jgi:DNA polymerase-3 subunit alpha